ncbi:MAG: NfeD family protein [Bacteroidia bacterium]|nr:NfeD family protein [Bacteroidia bacterium]MDW8346140.1 NfeD family protein [Bacteroidia bacterium]
MEIFTIITLLLSGFILIILEIIVLPGKAFFGTVGALMMLAGIGITFAEFSPWAGLAVLVGSLATVITSVSMAYKYGWLDRFIEKKQLQGKITNKEIQSINLQVGSEGKTKSPLRPTGLAEFNGKEIHVESSGMYVEPNTLIQVVAIEENKVIVRPK